MGNDVSVPEWVARNRRLDGEWLKAAFDVAASDAMMAACIGAPTAVGRLLKAAGYSEQPKIPHMLPRDEIKLAPIDTRFIRSVIEMPSDGGPVVIRYSFDVDGPLGARLAHLLAGDRRQRKRGVRLLRQHNIMRRSRPASFIIGDEIDAYSKGDDIA